MNFTLVELQKGLVKHNPPETYGDCHRAAVAMVLGVPVSDIPHFFDSPEKDWTVFEDWADENGIHLINFNIEGSFDFKELMTVMALSNQDRPYILGCKSSLGCNHSVVCQGREIFDPSPVDSGVEGPMTDGVYRVTYLVKTGEMK